ncbi:MAG TPA: hypothetical protein VGK99_08880 [Acidobacteriota bacterium]|jgi:hypothetical protein
MGSVSRTSHGGSLDDTNQIHSLSRLRLTVLDFVRFGNLYERRAESRAGKLLDSPVFVRPTAVTLHLSPYDVPEAVRGFYDEDLKRFVIEFRYIGDEPTERAESSVAHFGFRVGKNSSRIYAIEIDVDALKAKQVALKVELQKAIDNLTERVSSRKSATDLRKENYALAKEIITHEGSKIFEHLDAH